VTKRIALFAAALLAGCASFEKKPPPEPAAPPPEEAAPPVEPETPAKPPPPPPVEPAKPPKQELPGRWSSTSVSGPGSAAVRRIDMEFRDGGAWHGWMILEKDGKEQSSTLDGTWSASGDTIAIVFADGRNQAWGFRWDGEALVLRDGEQELQLRRQ
jgi:hypothetical protein